MCRTQDPTVIWLSILTVFGDRKRARDDSKTLLDILIILSRILHETEKMCRNHNSGCCGLDLSPVIVLGNRHIVILVTPIHF